VVATALLVAGGGSVTGVGIYVSALIAISVVCLILLPETAPGVRGGAEYADWPVTRESGEPANLPAGALRRT
jgi:hypothetical protein